MSTETSMTVQVKKAYVELYQLLQDNENCKVKTVLPQLIELMASKSGGGSDGKTYLKDSDGIVTHVYCYYHKKWEDVTVAEYGAKVSTASGLNTMCKEGVSQWTKQQRTKKLDNLALLGRVASGELQPGDIAEEQAKIVEVAKLIEPRADGHGFDELN